MKKLLYLLIVLAVLASIVLPVQWQIGKLSLGAGVAGAAPAPESAHYAKPTADLGDNFEWGANATSLATSGGDVVWTIGAGAATISTDRSYSTVIQPSTQDTFIREANYNENYNSLTYIEIYPLTSDREFGLIEFDVSSLPAGAIITSATMSLYYFEWYIGDPVGRAYYIHRLLRPTWTEAGATWNHYTGTSDWGTNGALNTVTDYIYTIGDKTKYACSVMPAAPGWVDWAVSDLTQDAFTNQSGKLILKISDLSGTASVGARFFNSEYADDTTLCPKLSITYYTNPPTGIRSAKLAGHASTTYITQSLTATTGYSLFMRGYKETATEYAYPLLHGDGSHVISVRIDGTEKIEYRNHAGTWTDSTGDITADAWFSMEVHDINWTSATYDLYLNGTRIVDDAQMYAASSCDDVWRIENDETNVGDDFYIDTVQVSHVDAWLGDWGGRVKLDIDYTNKIGGSVTWFPVFINVPDYVVETTGHLKYQRIAVTTSDGLTQLYVDSIVWSTLGGTIGQIWTSKTGWTISANTSIYLYYDFYQTDNTVYVGTFGDTVSENVWNTDFAALYHMDPYGDYTTLLDSTPNNRLSTKKSSTEPTAEYIAGSPERYDADFDGVHDYSQSANADLLGTSDNLTVSLWLYRDASYDNFGILMDTGFDVGAAGAKGNFAVLTNGSTYGSFWISYSYDGTNYQNSVYSTAIAASTWTMLTGVKNGATWNWYVNGAVDTAGGSPQTLTQTTMINKSQPITLGAYQATTTSYNYGGKMDEVWISPTAVSATTIKGWYNSQNDSLLTYNPSVTCIPMQYGSTGQNYPEVHLQGYGFTNTTAISFGAGITVNGFTVVSDTLLTGNITIDDTAGLRDITLTRTGGSLVLKDAFTVVDTPAYYEHTSVDYSGNTTVMPFITNGGNRYIATVQWRTGSPLSSVADEIYIWNADANWNTVGSAIATSPWTVMDTYVYTFTSVSGFEDEVIFCGTVPNLGYIAKYDFGNDTWTRDTTPNNGYLALLHYVASTNKFYINPTLAYVYDPVFIWGNKILSCTPADLFTIANWTVNSLPNFNAVGTTYVEPVSTVFNDDMYLHRENAAGFGWDTVKWDLASTYTVLNTNADDSVRGVETGSIPFVHYISIPFANPYFATIPEPLSNPYPHWTIRTTTDGTTWTKRISVASFSYVADMEQEMYTVPVQGSSDLFLMFQNQDGNTGSYWYLASISQGVIASYAGSPAVLISPPCIDGEKMVFDNQEWAGNAPQISIFTVIPPDISNTPSSHDFGVVQPSTTVWAKTNTTTPPSFALTDGNCTGNVTNDSSFVVNILFSMTTMIGGTPWTIGANPASNVFRMRLYISGAGNSTVYTALSATPTDLIHELAAAAHQHYEFAIDTPTNDPFSDGILKSGNMTLAAEAH